jgi:hypothetical protein
MNVVRTQLASVRRRVACLFIVLFFGRRRSDHEHVAHGSQGQIGYIFKESIVQTVLWWNSGKTCMLVHRSLLWPAYCIILDGECSPTSGIRVKVHIQGRDVDWFSTRSSSWW